MTSLPANVVTHLRARSAAVLDDPSSTDPLDAKLLQSLERLAGQKSLTLDIPTAVSLGTLFPVASRPLLANEAVIPLKQLISGLPSLTDILRGPSRTREDLKLLRRYSAFLERYISALPPSIHQIFLYPESNFIESLRDRYDSLGGASKLLGGGKINVHDDDPETWKVDLVRIKLSLLGILHFLLDQSGDGELMNAIHHLAVIAEASVGGGGVDGPVVPFIDRPLLGDYEVLCGTGGLLGRWKSTQLGAADPRVDFIRGCVGNVPGVHDRSMHALAWINQAFKGKEASTGHAFQNSSLPSVGKGKGKAQQNATLNPILEDEIMQVLAVLPDFSREDIRRCLEHPRFAGNVPKLLETLLDSGVPPDIVADAPSGHSHNDLPAASGGESQWEFTKDRRNVFDDEIDASGIHYGKRDAKEAALDRQTKANILRRVEELALEDVLSEESDHGELTYGVEEDLEGVDLDLNKGRDIKVGGDGEESDASSAEEEVVRPPKPKDVESLLAVEYLKDPNLFARDAATRRSKERADLKRRTDWTDEQIEGWRIMLERNPKKDKILEKHEFAGNVPGPLNNHHPQTSSSGGNSERGRGRGGRGRGGGRGSGGGGGEGSEDKDRTKQDRAWKDRHKSRGGNHDRKRGHDKKAAKMGLGAPPQ
ncbi:hypothetical protein SISSUDRAFT_1129595 [Sistotremastrum suecicum HHB10207 ss-3]|uniref:CUE domain-containing protein n=1 Tax=Sistotremastrum suecicum HHB10207 ss-3 TaxID=1314776 RepID=A0A166CHY1_9AGAM|nr:hypothetical protein SISSUDRAFT_1129595 [Sistotremastrum suecicum HHB10207 ss-3]